MTSPLSDKHFKVCNWLKNIDGSLTEVPKGAYVGLNQKYLELLLEQEFSEGYVGISVIII